MLRLWQYGAAAGAPADAPRVWPAGSAVARSSQLPTLVLLVHPHCPCSRATLEELAKIMTDCKGKLGAIVLMIHPAQMPPGWEKTDLWFSAASIPGVTVQEDLNGREASRFGAATSGQALLYSADGRLLFDGGITESRGHSGDNAGQSAITALALNLQERSPAQSAHTPVYGCSLFDGSAKSRTEAPASCRR